MAGISQYGVKSAKRACSSSSLIQVVQKTVHIKIPGWGMVQRGLPRPARSASSRLEKIFRKVPSDGLSEHRYFVAWSWEKRGYRASKDLNLSQYPRRSAKSVDQTVLRGQGP